MASAGIGDSLEGLHAVVAAVAAGRVTHLTIEQQRLRHTAYSQLIADAESSGARVEIVDDVGPLAGTTAPQGVVAEAEALQPATLETALGRTDPPALLVLDHLTDPRNVGAAARSALAAGVRALAVPTRRAAPLGATAFKSAAGAFEELSLVMVGSIPDLLRRLEVAGIWRLGLSASAQQSLFDHDLLAEPVALVIGGEGKGLSRLVGDLVDANTRIPVVGDTESLNASVAAALAVYELARVRGWVT